MKFLTVHKYPARLGSFDLHLPEGARVLTIQMQHDQPQLWALVDPHAELVPREFLAIGSGHQIEEELLTYIGTFQQDGGAFVWHLFECPNR